VIIILVVMLIGTIWGVNYVVVESTAKQIYNDVNIIPKNRVGLLLGTAKYRDKGKQIVNPYYQHRIDAAVALYMAGKIDYVIVSGDNSTVYYDEPELMKADLVARGVPANRIYKDNSGFRTLDSILRCRDVFSLTRVTIISQEFHNQRALFIANHKNVTAIAYNAADGDTFFDVYYREKLARVKMVLDLVMNKQARYSGERINIE
jgi:SanA protein